MVTNNSLLDFDTSLAQLLAAARRVKGRDQVALADAAGRILAESAISGAINLTAHRVITTETIRLAASAGCHTLLAYRRLSVGLLSFGEASFALTPLLHKLGCTVEDFGNVSEDFTSTRRALLKAGNLHDLVISTGGISADQETPVRQAIADLGEIRVWGAISNPALPFAFGKAGDADFIGLPENPDAALVAFALLVRPFIRVCQGGLPPTGNRPILPLAFMSELN